MQACTWKKEPKAQRTLLHMTYFYVMVHSPTKPSAKGLKYYRSMLRKSYPKNTHAIIINEKVSQDLDMFVHFKIMQHYKRNFCSRRRLLSSHTHLTLQSNHFATFPFLKGTYMVVITSSNSKQSVPERPTLLSVPWRNSEMGLEIEII